MIEAFNRGWKHGHVTEHIRLRHGFKRSFEVSQRLVDREYQYFPHRTSGESTANLLGMTLGNIHAVINGLYMAVRDSSKNIYPTEINVPLEMVNKNKKYE